MELLGENEPVAETETGDSYEVEVNVRKVINANLQSNKADLAKQLHVFGERRQILMFLTGPAGKGKSTTVIAAEVCRQPFCKVANIPRMDTTYVYNAYTGSATALVGGTTICKKARNNYAQNEPLPSSV